ncbi:MAG: YbdK family carboxylate-amine ligase, partial [Candidatus Electrothrix sp. AR4]|nr:YbdK family carboxylate-amine ligase [Candidatus Electrothrix sp. AR4]
VVLRQPMAGRRRSTRPALPPEILIMRTCSTEKEVIRPVFCGSRPYTLGVELEFQLLDRSTLDLVPRVHAILNDLAPKGSDRIVPEFLQSIIELQTGVCDSVDDAAVDLAQTIHLVEDVAEEEDCMLYSTSLHPFAEPTAQVLTEGDRYQRIMDELQQVGRQFITQGMHVHVGVTDGDAAVRVCDIIQVYLPILLALSTSSPFFCGQDTGFHSYRTKLFELLPLAGIAGHLGTWQGYADEVCSLQRHGAIKQLKDLWWDVRPSPGFGTVEIRICDLPSRFYHILGLTAVVQGLAAYIIERETASSVVSLQWLRYNKWQAARHGLDGRFIDPYALLGRSSLSLRQAAGELFKLIQPFTEQFRTTDYIRELCEVLRRGTSAERQRRLAGKENKF